MLSLWKKYYLKKYILHSFQCLRVVVGLGCRALTKLGGLLLSLDALRPSKDASHPLENLRWRSGLEENQNTIVNPNP